MRHDFTYTTESNPHGIRSKAILKKYPHIRDLIRPYPLSALYIILITLGQITIAYYVNDKSIWVMLSFAFIVGAIANHALFVMIHEACHNAIFKGNTANKVIGIVCNLAQGFPSAIGFRTFHLVHHSNLNELDYDADLAFHFEAKLVKNIWWRKVIWYLLFMFIEAVRPMKLKNTKLFDGWVFLNIVIVIAFNILIYLMIGPMALYYILISTFFSVGLHPVGARWIQEHYTYKEGQETYSYYGPLNKLSFNIGYHNEHHDFLKIPWVYLPKVRAIAPEYYNDLYYHTSWTKVLFDFIFNKNIDLYMRIVRKKRSHA
ncbi:stearoyl-CoA 9-desaturase [Bacteriovorax sp. BSW11_IV]|uniref:fatty acid desaturase n=1 Tax=Bacteriovorax sp. BSW11_IV TaxID=1353529 RepID=UPI00038A024C|nr:fatty acid desaturase [Bacteriovorax sp. BSW11_IV]EQC43038.1 stearoyl-CoA 9-desaturase [Bacteriovorax sp. BSW11_IV]